MRVYPRAAEENLRDADLIREWTDSGLLQESQRAALATGLAVDLRTLHVIFRVLLFGFSALIVVAIVALFGIQMDINEDIEVGVLLLFSAIACFAAAWMLAEGVQLYRCGGEEAVAVLGVVFSGLATGFIFESYRGLERPLVAAMTAAAGACFIVYAKLGLRYMGVAGVLLAGAAPLALDAGIVAERVLAASIYAAIVIATRRRLLAQRDELPGPDYAWMQAFAWVGIYAALHQRLPWIGLGIEADSRTFYWFTYIMIWILPATGIWRAIRDRDRILLDTSAAMALMTLITNKPYLGWTRHAWDPILLGFLLIATAVVLRRWLSAGAKASRAGFTADRMLGKETRYVEAASIASLAVQQPDVELPKSSDTGGGRSGGAGASGNF